MNSIITVIGALFILFFLLVAIPFIIIGAGEALLEVVHEVMDKRRRRNESNCGD